MKQKDIKKFIYYIIESPFKFFKYFIIGIKNIFFYFPLYIILKLKKSQKKLSKIFLIPSIITYLICVFLLTRWYVQSERTKNFSNSMKEQEIIIINNTTNTIIDNQKPTLENNISNNTSNNNKTNSNTTNNSTKNNNLNFLKINLDYYIKKNPETIGWIKIDGTNINYPIVQHKDNSYYLDHDFNKKKSKRGWIFADYRNTFDTLNHNTIIYGHNLINNTMFGEIPEFLNKSWLNKTNKPTIKISTKNHNTIWEIFSLYKTKPTIDYLQTNFNSLENYSTFLNKLKKKSIKNLNINILPTDKIITLSTCDNSGKNRVVVHAKLIKITNK